MNLTGMNKKTVFKVTYSLQTIVLYIGLHNRFLIYARKRKISSCRPLSMLVHTFTVFPRVFHHFSIVQTAVLLK
jgi:hypothetical protein